MTRDCDCGSGNAGDDLSAAELIGLDLKRGRIFEACDRAAAARMSSPDDIRLIQLHALALARLGAAERARAILEAAYDAGHNDPETSGILGRVYKDLWQSGACPDAACRSRELYASCFERNGDYYTGINAAAMTLLSGDAVGAEKIARRVIDAVHGDDYWARATLGEAYLIAGDPDAGARHYRDARAAADGGIGDRNSTYRQMLLLSKALSVPAGILEIFRPPAVVAFSGHMLDRPERAEPRFPAGIEGRVRRELDLALERIGAGIGYCSAACGADIIFIEAMRARGAEITVLLPFALEDFLRTSVSYAGPAWRERFDRIVREVPVKYVTEEGYFGDDGLFGLCGKIIMGLCALHAAVMRADPWFVAVLSSRDMTVKEGGTRDIFGQWPWRERAVHIDSAKFLPEKNGKAMPAGAEGDIPAVGGVPFGIAREPRCILFADIVGFSKLHEEHTPYFMYRLLQSVSDGIRGLRKMPEILNTWGDAIFAVYDLPGDLARFAFALNDVIHGTEWDACNLPVGMSIRIALHAGPVFIGTDPICGSPNAYGSHINRAARMEPVTQPGCVYASEQFAALLAVEDPAEYDFNYVGTIELPKNFGSQEMYRLTRREAVTL